MNEKNISIDLNDERIGNIAEIIGSKTCRNILGVIADGEMSESEIAGKLKIPLNTAGYNIKKLVKAGLIEKSSDFLWSVKGKRIAKYRLVNKKIVISPRSSSIRGLVPAFAVSILAAVGLKLWQENTRQVYETSASDMYAFSQKAAVAMAEPVSANVSTIDPSVYFIIGALIALIIVSVYNWRKIW